MSSSTSRPAGSSGGAAVPAVIWLPGLAVALGAAVATAHGLFEVALAARVPGGIAALYPLITDGLALVAYAATTHLTGPAAHYAWTVVILAAGLSGLAQAAYLAGGATLNASAALRFGVGAWPAIAAAIVAHLLYLLAAHDLLGAHDAAHRSPDGGQRSPGVQRSTGPVEHPGPALYGAEVDLPSGPAPDETEAAAPAGVQAGPGGLNTPADPLNDGGERAGPSVADAPARDRAHQAATGHLRRHGGWPTVSEVEAAAGVSRGTAAAALKALREQPPPLHLITNTEQNPDESTQP